MKTVIKSSNQFSGLSWNRLDQSNPKSIVETVAPFELIQRIEAVRNRISDLRLQCEELRIVLRQNLTTINHCAKCGKQIMRDEAVTYKLDAEKKLFCKECFTEILK